MATEITMPQLGESVHEGSVSRWLKQPGDRVEQYEPLVEIITDKVTAEIPSPVAGTVARIVVEAGATVSVGQPIAVVEERMGSMAPPPGVLGVGTDGAQLIQTPESHDDAASAASARPPSQANGHDWAADADRATIARKRSSPVVRRIAQEHGIGIQQVEGTGLGGRVTKLDILRYLAQRDATAAEPSTSTAWHQHVPTGPGGWRPDETPVSVAQAPEVPASPATPAPEPSGSEPAEVAERVPLTPMRRSIAEHLTRSMQTIPHAWTMMEVDVSQLVALRAALKADFQRRERVPLTAFPFLIAAVVRAVKQYPAVNARWADGEILRHRHVHVGIAVSLGDDGLVVPVIRDADQRNIAGLAHAVHDLVTRARSNRLRIDEVQGATITVNNPGAFGSILSAPIVPHGQTMNVTMEAIVKRPVVVDDAIAIRSMMNICCAFDHRVIDGETAGRFLAAVKRELEAFGPASGIY